MKRFRIRTLGILTAVLCLFLSLNVIPWRAKFSIYIDDGRSYFPIVKQYGWPYTYLHKYVDKNLPNDITQWSVVDDNRLFHALDNIVICTGLALLVTFLIVRGFRYFKNRKSRQL